MMKFKFSHRFRRSLMAAGFAAAASFTSACAFAREGTGDEAVEPAAIAVIAHRGGAMLRPENTMPAFEHAAQIGADYLEFDMEMTADDRVAVYHDATINPDFCIARQGSTLEPGPVRELTLAELQEFDCGAGVRPAYAGDRHVSAPSARIPEMEELLGAFSDSDALFFAETKIPGDSDVDPVKFAAKLEAAVRENGLEDRLILQSFDYRTIDALHRINPRIRTCLLGAARHTSEYLSLLRRHDASCIVLSDEEVEAEGVRALQKAGILVFSGVVDTEADWQKYVALGVDAIFTNDPERAIDFLRRAGLHD